jgi:hypothetical protein
MPHGTQLSNYFLCKKRHEKKNEGNLRVLQSHYHTFEMHYPDEHPELQLLMAFAPEAENQHLHMSPLSFKVLSSRIQIMNQEKKCKNCC